MKRWLISGLGAMVILGAASLRLRLAGPSSDLAEPLRTSALATVAKHLASPAGAMAAGWGQSDLPMPKTQTDPEHRAVHPDLSPRISVLVVGQPRKPQAAIISVEVLMITDRLDALLKAYAGEVLDLPQERIVCVATHSHAAPRPEFGPFLRVAFGGPELPEKGLAASVAYAANEARKGYGVVRIGAAAAELSTYVANRSPGAKGRIDDTLRAMVIHRSARQLLLWSYAAHPTLVPRNHRDADGDYPARVAKLLEQGRTIDQVIFLPGRTANATVASQRNPDRLAEALASSLSALATVANNNLGRRGGVAFSNVDMPSVEPLLPLYGPVAFAPWVSRWGGSQKAAISLLTFGPAQFTFVSGEVSNSASPSAGDRDWTISLAGSGLGYVVDPADRNRSPERPLVVLNDGELRQLSSLLKLLSGAP